MGCDEVIVSPENKIGAGEPGGILVGNDSTGFWYSGIPDTRLVCIDSMYITINGIRCKFIVVY